MGFVPKLSFNVENFPFIVSGIRYVCTGLTLHMHVPWPCVQVDSCVRKPKSSLSPYFLKIDLFAH